MFWCLGRYKKVADACHRGCFLEILTFQIQTNKQSKKQMSEEPASTACKHTKREGNSNVKCDLWKGNQTNAYSLPSVSVTKFLLQWRGNYYKLFTKNYSVFHKDNQSVFHKKNQSVYHKKNQSVYHRKNRPVFHKKN